MKLKPIEFGAKTIVPENPNDTGKIDAIKERILLSDTESLDLKGITALSKFQVILFPEIKWKLLHMESELPRFLTVIGIKKWENTWMFLCGSQETFLSIANEFALSFRLKETDGQEMVSYIKIKKGHAEISLERAYSEAERAFAGFLLKASDPVVESCLISDIWNLDKVYEILLSFLPHNTDKKAIFEMKQLKAEYGKDFARKKELLESYRQSVSEDNFLSQAENIQKEMERWIRLTREKKIDREFGEAYVEILQEKMEIIKDEVRNYLNRTDFVPGSEQDCKSRLLEQLESIPRSCRDKMVSLYRDYCDWENRLEEIDRKFPQDTVDLKIPQYLKFYHLGRIMIGKYLDQGESDYDEEKQILQEELDQAMIYFYETDTAQEAWKMEKYMKSRRKGLRGEKEVDYALKWLDKNYVTVPKITDRRHRMKTIALINPDFKDESQEYDHIVIGRQGVFAIETKDYSGSLNIDTYGNWIRRKEDGIRVGERNPLQQIDRHVKLLRSFLKDDIPVIAVICIANRETIIEGQEHCPIPLIKSDMLARFIEDYPLGGRELSEDEIKECLSAIEDHRYR
ncbi:MAG: hypothetical protein HDR23_09130 [Lachnospiraceae bacterium]|nr:hypothetical protein [Lachnospiraceae bacterium]MBD5456607.1 hypothetical protein [Lachnospiraceae bacterium]